MNGAPKILVVEDDPEMKSLLRDFLSRQGYGVVTAMSGAGALRLLEGGTFDADLVVSDVRMAPMSGLELTRRLSSQSPDVPVVLMSAFGDAELEREALRCGAKRYVKKPFSLLTMEGVVRDVIAAAQAAKKPKAK